MAVLCKLACPTRYRPFDWNMLEDPEDCAYWLGLFEGFPDHLERLIRQDGQGGADFESRWAAFRTEYQAGIDARRADPAAFELTTVTLGRFRRDMLLKHGWPDPYRRVKQMENSIAEEIYAEVVARIDAVRPRERWEPLLRGLFAGNMFDLGSPRTIEMYHRGEIDFFSTLAGIGDRPWFIDDADAVIERFNYAYRGSRVLFFVDNAGSDIVLGVIPLVREMARNDVRVVLAANSGPALNDITLGELNPLLERLAGRDAGLAELLAARRITTVGSGTSIPLIDLSEISDECDAAARDCDLIVLQGMGRGVESNWRQRFTCDVWRVALVKDEIVAKWLGAKVFDIVCRFEEGTGRG